MISNVLYNTDRVFVLDQARLDELKRIALAHPLKRSRICVHAGPQSPVQEMVIVAHRDTLIEAHRHPSAKPESYHLLEGRLLVKIFADDGSVVESIELSADANPKMYRIEGGVWHQPIPLSEWVVYHEVFTGPFEKEVDVLYAEWN